MSEIESRLYDQFNLKVSEVKVLLADSGKQKRCFVFFQYFLKFSTGHSVPALLTS